MSASSVRFQPLNPLEELGEKFKPSKRMHDYLRHYWRYLRDVRNDVQTVLEIGVQGGGSLRMWAEFFPNATIHGYDSDPSCRSHEADRIVIHCGDQGDAEELRRLSDRIGAADLIIDDGSHVADHQILSF